MYDDILGEEEPKPEKPKSNPNPKKPLLVKLSGDEIRALTDADDGREFWFKLIRLYDPLPTTEWRGKARIHIQEMKGGGIGVLTPKPNTIPISWAEYCDDDITDTGECVCEDYSMTIWQEVK